MDEKKREWVCCRRSKTVLKRLTRLTLKRLTRLTLKRLTRLVLNRIRHISSLRLNVQLNLHSLKPYTIPLELLNRTDELKVFLNRTDELKVFLNRTDELTSLTVHHTP